jgi:hypothetical protein
MRYTKMTPCAFCGNEATCRNQQGLATCMRHRKFNMDNLRCLCGEPANISIGKFGAYAKCANCGNVTLKKILEVN